MRPGGLVHELGNLSPVSIAPVKINTRKQISESVEFQDKTSLEPRFYQNIGSNRKGLGKQGRGGDCRFPHPVETLWPHGLNQAIEVPALVAQM